MDVTKTFGVEGLSGRVAAALRELTPDDLLDVPGQPADAAWLRCDRLDVLLLDLPKSEDSPPIQVQAAGRVQLEGPKFRATADTASVDGATGLVKFRADGGRQASIWVRRESGGTATPTSATSIQFNPRTRTFETEGLKGLSGVLD